MITLNEIEEQPKKLLKISEGYQKISKRVMEFLKENEFSEMDFVGCGTSYNLAMGLSFQFNRLKKGERNSKFFSGSEVAFGLAELNKNSVVVGLSRSGESTETVLALKRAKENGIKTIGITCENGSSLTKVSDVSVVLDFVEEKSVVMTQSFTSMAFFTSALIRQLFDSTTLQTYLETIPSSAEKILYDGKKFFDEFEIKKYEHFVLLGYDEYFASCLEGVTKITETSLSEAEAFQTMEYRHGPKSKVSDKTLACILSNHLLISEEEKMAEEIIKLGGQALNISNEEMRNISNLKIPYSLDDFGDWFLRVIPLQLLGVKKALAKGLNPDNPRNLTRVVKL